MTQIAEKITKPSSCFLGICLPLSKQDFINDLQETSLKSYAKTRRKILKFNPESLYHYDHEPLVNLIKDVRAKIENMGVFVKSNFTLADVKQIINYQVVAILGH